MPVPARIAWGISPAFEAFPVGLAPGSPTAAAYVLSSESYLSIYFW
jgi:hypothetical protein